MHAAFEEGPGGGRWLDEARDTVEKRIATYPPGSVSPGSCFEILGLARSVSP